MAHRISTSRAWLPARVETMRGRVPAKSSSQLVLRQMLIDLSKDGSSQESDIGTDQTERLRNGFRENVVNFCGTAQVLVVDRDPTMRNMVVRYLEEHDVRAASASGQQEMRGDRHR